MKKRYSIRIPKGPTTVPKPLRESGGYAGRIPSARSSDGKQRTPFGASTSASERGPAISPQAMESAALEERNIQLESIIRQRDRDMAQLKAQIEASEGALKGEISILRSESPRCSGLSDPCAAS